MPKGCVQDLGQPLLTLEQGIAAKSFFVENGANEGIRGVKREVGDAAKALAMAKNVIKGARCVSCKLSVSMLSMLLVYGFSVHKTMHMMSLLIPCSNAVTSVIQHTAVSLIVAVPSQEQSFCMHLVS